MVAAAAAADGPADLARPHLVRLDLRVLGEHKPPVVVVAAVLRVAAVVVDADAGQWCLVPASAADRGAWALRDFRSSSRRTAALRRTT